jgi:pimeloyl-ACP methyl ester carboxylesterase
MGTSGQATHFSGFGASSGAREDGGSGGSGKGLGGSDDDADGGSPLPSALPQAPRLLRLLEFACAAYRDCRGAPLPTGARRQPLLEAPGCRVIVDCAQGEVLLAVPGSQCWADWAVTNLHCTTVPIGGQHGVPLGHAHEGFHARASRLATPRLLAALEGIAARQQAAEPQGGRRWSIVCVGHSLGGAVAQLLAMQLRELREMRVASAGSSGSAPPLIYAVGFGAPPCVTQHVAEHLAGLQPPGACMPLQQNIVNVGDAVPLCSSSTIARACAELSAAAAIGARLLRPCLAAPAADLAGYLQWCADAQRDLRAAGVVVVVGEEPAQGGRVRQLFHCCAQSEDRHCRKAYLEALGWAAPLQEVDSKAACTAWALSKLIGMLHTLSQIICWLMASLALAALDIRSLCDRYNLLTFLPEMRKWFVPGGAAAPAELVFA